MPLYEYECDACGHRFELIRKFSDPPLEACPACGGAVHKLQSASSFQFKGAGWYVTDYARKDAPGSKSDGSGKAGDGTDKDKGEKQDEKKADKKETAGGGDSASSSGTPASSTASTAAKD